MHMSSKVVYHQMKIAWLSGGLVALSRWRHTILYNQLFQNLNSFSFFRLENKSFVKVSGWYLHVVSYNIKSN